ncbi:MAG: ABC transporter ATP-binding protein [Rubrivivax sp.]|jgi:putative ABC transport system ATP-binding protein|nr:ABC transporter ATP-binding protein [Rubrivivax sp.]
MHAGHDGAMDPSMPVLRLRGIHKSYRLGAHEVPALRGVDLELQRGEMLALTGPSGGGKSTLLNIAGLIDRADAGYVELRGRALAALPEREATLIRRDAIGFVFQGFNLVPVMTVWDNVDYALLLAGVPAPQRRERVQAVLQAVGLAAHAQHRPDALSGGQRQRVAIARALVKRPTLVIADEPTASLDSDTADQVLALMREQAERAGAAFLLATHDERLLARCDRVLRLRDGRILPENAALQAA